MFDHFFLCSLFYARPQNKALREVFRIVGRFNGCLSAMMNTQSMVERRKRIGPNIGPDFGQLNAQIKK
ncbi:hypothetical protein [Ensifer sp. LCM 4579]|uniref:hypothetical protein n=1 Tax=Ensifer sp. LCM 4579 TaxID=1848292 RepID=UPI00104259AC|nr:hypothetical protein [Ensifer sp. LCM 4579]